MKRKLKVIKTEFVCDINCRLCHDAIQKIHDVAEAYLIEHRQKNENN